MKNKGIQIIEREIVSLTHTQGQIEAVVFKDGTSVNLKALYAKLPFEQHADIPGKMGCDFSPSGHIQVDVLQKTSIPGVFACGDNTTFRSRNVFCGTPPPAPANDDCANAIALTPGVVFADYALTTTSLGATSNVADPLPSCGAFGFDTNGKDVWYSVVVPEAGTITVLGRDVSGLSKHDRLQLRKDLQIVFQDPFASLDPRLPIGDAIAEPLRAFKVPRDQQDTRISELLSLVGLNPDHASRYPSEFSGGQRHDFAARCLADRDREPDHPARRKRAAVDQWGQFAPVHRA